MRSSLKLCTLGSILLLSFGSACNGCDDTPTDDPESDMGMTRTDMDTRPDMARGDMPAPIDSGGDLGADMSGDMPLPSCEDGAESCPRGAICVAGMCELASCDQLDCAATERCEALTQGGAACVDNQCGASSECPESRYCSASGVCELDTCTASAATCDATGTKLTVCADDGSAFGDALTCPLGCDTEGGEAFCGCRDDWECPTFMRCEAGRCQGSGRAPECTLEPVPFDQAKPTLEMSWGSKLVPEKDNPAPEFVSVAMTTLVANLDDDNGDGVINELDFPEILFVSGRLTQPDGWTAGGQWNQMGVLRVLHGGGPQRGEQMFSVCDEQVWRPGDDLAGFDCDLSQGMHFRTFGSIAVGDLDGDGTPEIVTMARSVQMGGNALKVRLYSPTGALLAESEELNTRDGGIGALAISLSDVDEDGMSEVLVGAAMVKFARDAASGDWSQVAQFAPETQPLTIACAGDFTPDAGVEWFDRMVLWRAPKQPANRATQADCDGNEPGEDGAWCRGELQIVWDKRDEIKSLVNPNNTWQGICAVADVLTADGTGPSPGDGLDGEPEIVLIGEEELVILDAASGELLLRQDLNGLMGDPAPGRSTSNGGAPNVDDFDGDGFPEIGTAFGSRYVMIDVQPASAACQPWQSRSGTPMSCQSSGMCGEGEFCAGEGAEATCRCLNNAWVKVTEDDSSRRTGSSVFDFNGDGAAEVIYNDECFFRIYDGRNGDTLFEQPSEHITNIEYPAVVDVDNDGNAEIVFSATTQGTRCSIRNNIDPVTGMAYNTIYNSGVQVWGDANDAWVSARRIWNQHAYSVTNVYEDGKIPQEFVPNWRSSTQGLLYNTYRSNPRSQGIAPDLVIDSVRLSSPQMGCGQLTTTLAISGRIRNQGDLRVGPGVALVAYGEWDGGARRKLLKDGTGAPLTFLLTQSIEPGRSVRFELLYDALQDGETAPPERIELVIDPDPAVLAGSGLMTQSERECCEDNNSAVVAVEEQALPDLKIVSISSDNRTCPLLSVSVTVKNEGSAPVSGLKLSLYAGAPDLGGRLLTTVEDTMALAPGEERTLFGEPDLRALGLEGFLITVHAVVEPLSGEDECNLSNNVLSEGESVFCAPG